MRVLDILNNPDGRIEQIRPELKLTEKIVEAPDLVNLIDRQDGNRLSLIQRIGTYDQVSEGCKSITDTMRTYLGVGMKFNTTSVQAKPGDPLAPLYYDKEREGGMIGTYDFSQKGNPLCSTYY